MPAVGDMKDADDQDGDQQQHTRHQPSDRWASPLAILAYLDLVVCSSCPPRMHTEVGVARASRRDRQSALDAMLIPSIVTNTSPGKMTRVLGGKVVGLDR